MQERKSGLSCLLADKTKMGDLRMSSGVWQGISSNFKDLISGMLQVCPDDRLSLQEISDSPALNGHVNSAPITGVNGRLDQVGTWAVTTLIRNIATHFEIEHFYKCKFQCATESGKCLA